ncbi:MAG TPA: LuxR C-terminal-related transcriptional regulator [Chloroflexota bacterium]|nr:LuxR C-terminal-related transcriptional regulator [Chloroflexota bacterium]
MDSTVLRREVLRTLKRVIPIDAAFFATTDPATLLFTSAVVDDVLSRQTALFLQDEFLEDDANKFAELTRRRGHVSSLLESTRRVLAASWRYREILEPAALGDELRAALMVDGACWGVLCLHRERARVGFSPAEQAFLARVAPHIAIGLRAAVTRDAVETSLEHDGPGLVLLTDDLSIIAMSAVAERLIQDLDGIDSQASGLPWAVTSVAARLRELEMGARDASEPRVRVRTRGGEWLAVHATRMAGGETRQIAVILDRAQPMEIAPLIVQTYGLSPRESEITRLIAQAFTTSEISATCHITADTVQDHCKSIFEKVGVRSRRELVAQLYERHFRH